MQNVTQAGHFPTLMSLEDKWFRMLMNVPSNRWHFLTVSLSTVCFAFCLHNNYQDLFFIIIALPFSGQNDISFPYF